MFPKGKCLTSKAVLLHHSYMQLDRWDVQRPRGIV